MTGPDGLPAHDVVLAVEGDVVVVRPRRAPVRTVALVPSTTDDVLQLPGPPGRVLVTASSVAAVRLLAEVLDPAVAAVACTLEVETSEHVARRRRGRWAYGAGEVHAGWRPTGGPGPTAALRLEARPPAPRRLRVLLEDLVREVVPAPPSPAMLRGVPEQAPVVDPALVAPAGFTADHAGPLARLHHDREQVRLLVGEQEVAAWRGTRTPDDGDVARLRPLRGVVVTFAPDAPGTPRGDGAGGDGAGGDGADGDGGGEVATGRRVLACVAALACAGVPMAADHVPAWAAAALGGEVQRALLAAEPGAWTSSLRREEDSVALRRAALRTFCPPPDDEVSVLAATRRPEMVGQLLAGIRRQRGARAEVVLSLHGVPVEHPHVAAALAAHAGAEAARVTVLQPPAGLPFGSVLQQAAGAASCEVLTKMDDDDWYGEHHLADMLLGLHVSGADLVGSPPDFVHLESFGVTVRRSSRSETLSRFVAGGTLTLRRRTLAEVGGFRPVPGVGEDRALLDDVLADSGAVYRTHGLGYVLRRTAHGHTWQASSRYFLAPGHVQASGLVGSRQMGSGWEGAGDSERARWRPGLLPQPAGEDLPDPVRPADATAAGLDVRAPRGTQLPPAALPAMAADLAATGVRRLRVVVDGPDAGVPEVAVEVVARAGGDGDLLVDGARYGIGTQA